METSSKPAIFFDLDDTLYDHLVPFREAVREVLSPAEGSVDYKELFYTVRHHSDLLWPQYLRGELALEETRVLRLERAFAEMGMELNHEQAALVQEAYISRQYRIELIEGVREQLERFLAADYQVGIITNGPKEHQMNKIRGLGVDKIIKPELIFISDAVGLAKPDPAIFAHVNEVTGTSPDQSVYVGDTWANDVVGALAAGWKVCWYNPRSRLPGSAHEPSYIFRDYKEFGELPIG
ncbi:HAD family hydrolase [Paenibacillus donghaensis]|uniref:HAD family hydrolase n=1 Tax=Paenibacillus donghaensis TaxID=414771 RepID=A0A2Z2K543_9BACL|nr:HAD family hydrolase [Paenibacillus donghaensis]ASA19627.1 hypothetical protein B9T62_01610 [Paenibacillus donghaensis]